MRFLRMVLLSVLIFYVPLAARAETAPDDVIEALAKASSDEVVVHGLVDTTAMTPLGNGLALVDARWQGHELVGLIENNGLLPGQLRIEGTVVSRRGTNAFVGVGYAADGTSNSIVFLAPDSLLPEVQGQTIILTDVLVSSLTLHATDHRLLTTPAGTPFAAAVVRARLLDDPFFFDVNAATVLETPLGPIGIASDARGIMAILVGL